MRSSPKKPPPPSPPLPPPPRHHHLKRKKSKKSPIPMKRRNVFKRMSCTCSTPPQKSRFFGIRVSKARIPPHVSLVQSFHRIATSMPTCHTIPYHTMPCRCQCVWTNKSQPVDLRNGESLAVGHRKKKWVHATDFASLGWTIQFEHMHIKSENHQTLLHRGGEKNKESLTE